MKKITSSGTFFLDLLLGSVFFLSLSIILIQIPLLQQPNQEHKPRMITDDQEKTLGESTTIPRIFIKGGENYGGGVISLTSLEEPVVEIGSYKTSGNAEVNVYKGGEEDLLNYLAHDEKGNQLSKEVDISQLEYLTTFNVQINANYNQGARATLPIEGSGVWCLQVKLGGSTEYAFVVRSAIAAILKEGDNELIFWGQDLTTKRSLANGNIRIFKLLGGVSEIANFTLDQEGVGKVGINPEADIGLIKQGEELALIPINLHYLNQNYEDSYEYFQFKQRRSIFYVFTDRPIYKPGDKIYFKSIIRDDDDVRYTIPSGTAQVRLLRGWGEENMVVEKSYSITSEGTVYGEFDLPKNIKTGDYNLEIDLAPGTNNYSLKSYRYFQVEYFRKPEYTIDINVPQREYIAGDKSSFTISGNYFFGQPLASQQVKYKISSSDFYEYNYFSEKIDEFINDYQYGWWGGNVIKEGTVDLNKDGKVEVNFELILPENKHSTQVFSIEAEFDDGSGNPVFERRNILVYPGEYGIYRKAGSYAARVGEQTSLGIILVPRRQTSVEGVPLRTKIKRTTWIPYYEPDKKYPSYKKEEEEMGELNATTGKDGEVVFNFTPTKTGSYQLSVEGKDNRGNTIIKEFYIWVVSPDQPLYSGGQETGLMIQPDKESYTHTEVARLTINSEVANRDIFLSLDRARVNRFQVVHLDGKSTIVEVPLEATDIPNIYLKVASFSDCCLDSASEKILVSTDPKRLLVAIIPDKKNYGPGETATINIQTTDFGGNAVSADVAIWAVDKAIFELAEDYYPKIFDVFWRERWDDTAQTHSLQGINVELAEGGGGCFSAETPILMSDGKTKPIKEVKTGDTILTRKSESASDLVGAKVIGIHSQEVSGYLIINGNLRITTNHRLWVNGGWQEAGNIQKGDSLLDYNNQEVMISSIEWQAGKFLVYNLTIEKYKTYFAQGFWAHNQKGANRQVFKDTAYWNPSVQTDTNGRAQVSFKLPDNLTTWVVASTGSTWDTKVGQTTTEIVVGKDIVVRPILPNILRIDDEIVLSSLIHNFTEQDHPFDIALKFDSGEIKSADYSKVLIKSKDFTQANWEVRPNKENEKSKLIFSGQADDDQKLVDKITQEIPVLVFGFWEKRGENAEGATEFSVKLAVDSDREKSVVRLSLAPTILGTLPAAMRYLVGYPWGCAEQVTSHFIPAIIAKTNPDIFSQVIADKNVDGILEESVAELNELQRGDGGWRWWFVGNSDSFISAYVVESLLEARKSGVEIDEQIFREAKQFFEKESYFDYWSGQDKKYTDEENVAKVYGLSLLGAESGKKQLEAKNEYTADVLALVVMTNVRNGYLDSKSNGLDLLIAKMKTQGDTVYWEEGAKPHFGSKDASTALAIRAILAAGGDRELAVKATRFLIRNRKSDYWSNTFATAQVVKAVVGLAKTGEETIPNYNYSIKLDGKIIDQGLVTDYQKPLAEIEIKGIDIKEDGSKIVIEKSGETGQLYSTLIIEEFHTDKKAKAVNKGFEVKREYLNEKGEDYTLGVGDTVIVRITAVGLGAQENYGVIVDELPSGLIPINPVLKSEGFDLSYSGYEMNVSGMEVTQNGMAFSLYRVEPGTHTYTYKARVVSEGKFIVPPVAVSLMYAPEIYGLSEVQTVEIEETSKLIPRKVIEGRIKSMVKEKGLLIGGVIIIMILIGGRVFILRKKGGSIQFLNRFKKKPPLPPQPPPPPSPTPPVSTEPPVSPVPPKSNG